MILFLYVALLATLLKALLLTERPGLCAGIHAVGLLVLVWADTSLGVGTAQMLVDDIGFPWWPFIQRIVIWSLWGWVFFFALSCLRPFSYWWVMSFFGGVLLRFGLTLGL